MVRPEVKGEEGGGCIFLAGEGEGHIWTHWDLNFMFLISNSERGGAGAHSAEMCTLKGVVNGGIVVTTLLPAPSKKRPTNLFSIHASLAYGHWVTTYYVQLFSQLGMHKSAAVKE